jgi:hypothetical protein
MIDQVIPPSQHLALVVIGKGDAIREGLRRYGPVTEVKLSDPEFRPH